MTLKKFVEGGTFQLGTALEKDLEGIVKFIFNDFGLQSIQLHPRHANFFSLGLHYFGSLGKLRVTV